MTVHDGEDRLEDREGRVEDHGRAPEGGQDPAHGGDGGGEAERVQLHAGHADAEGGGGPLVGAHGDEPAPDPPPPQVGHPDGDGGEAAQRQHRVALGMGRGVDLHPEERRCADLGAGDPARTLAVVEDQALQDERQPDRHHGQVHPARPQGGEPDEDADRHGPGDPDQRGHLEGDVVVRHEAGRHPRPGPGQRDLRQRQLAREAGDDRQRQDDDGPDRRGRGRLHQSVRGQRGEPARRHHDRHHRRHGIGTAAPDLGRPGRALVAQGQRPAPHGQHDDDHGEGHRPSPPGEEARIRHLGLEEGDLGLEDPDDEAAEQRERERAEAPDQRRGQTGDDQEGETDHLEPGHVHDQDGGGDRQHAAEGPVGRGDEVRRPSDQREVALLLRHRGRGQPEAGPPVDRHQHEAGGGGDARQQEPVAADDEVAAQLDGVDRQQLGHDPGAVAPALEPERETEGQQAERGDEPGQRRGIAQRPHHEEVGARADRAPHPQREDEGERGRHPAVAPQVEPERADHAERALGEVDDPRAPVDDDDALAGQRVDGARPQAEQGEADHVHAGDSRPGGA